VLRPVLDRPSGSAEVNWIVGPRLTAEGTVRLTLPAGLAVAEFDLPAIQIDEIRAPDLYSWVRVGSRVQLWLKKPVRELAARWTGSLDPAAKPDKQSAPTGIELPIPRPSEGTAPTTVHVRPVAGWLVQPEPGPGVRWLPTSTADQIAEVESTAPRITVLPPAPPAEVAVREAVEVAGNALRYTASLTLNLTPGRSHHFSIALGGLASRVEVDLKGPPGVAIAPLAFGTRRPTWSIFVPAASPGPLEFTATAHLPVGRLPAPLVHFGGPPIPRADRPVLVVGPGLEVNEGPPGWRLASSGEGTVAPPPGHTTWVAVETIGTWSVQAGALLGAASPPSTPPGDPGSTLPDSLTQDSDLFASLRDWTAAVGALAALLTAIALVTWAPSNWWPERVTACGAFGTILLGPDSPPGLALATLAAAGLTARLLLAMRRVLR
jgi:hypothetical protein